MGYLEDRILNSFVEKPLVWWRYIDDIFMIWQHGEEKLTETYFLDVEVIRSGHKLLIDLYIKPTDTHRYLEFSSCHVYHSKKSIPYSQALRFNRI